MKLLFVIYIQNQWNFFGRALFTLAVVSGGISFADGALADEVFKPTAGIILITNEGVGTTVSSFGTSVVDPVIGLYALADTTDRAVDLVDTTTNALITMLQPTPNFAGQPFTCPTGNPPDCAGPNGVVFVSNREIWASDGDSTIKVIDLFSRVTTHVITTGGNFRADKLCVDPRDDIALIANDAERTSPMTWPFVTFVSTANHNVMQRVTMDGTQGRPAATNGIEQCQRSRHTGKFYLNLPEINGPGNDTQPGAVAVLSPTTLSIEKVFPIPLSDCAGPTGMAIGPGNQILLGCSASSSSVIIDARDGHVVAALPNEGGSDEVYFNDGDDHYFLANSSPSYSNNQLLGVVDAGSHQEDQSTTTGLTNTPGLPKPRGLVHSVAADPVMNQVYMPIPNDAQGLVCSSAGVSDFQGCIAVFTASNDDQQAAAPGDHGR